MEKEKKEIIKHFKARGKVQGIMFRQTLIRGAQKRGILAGASNCRKNRNTGFFCLAGDEDEIEEFITLLKSGIELNNWGCKTEEIEELNTEKSLRDYEVTTENVDKFNWNPNITLYL